MTLLLQVLSLAGAGLILLAYFALQRGRWSAHNQTYLWCNFLGSVMLTVVAAIDGRLGFIVLEAAWALVTLRTMIGAAARGTEA